MYRPNPNDVLNLYTMDTNHVRLGVMNLGATIKYLQVKDKNGYFQDVVLGYKSLDDYYTNRQFFGTIVGRNANRIKDAHFEINGVGYDMDKNEHENNLHSGKSFFHKRLYNADHVAPNALKFSLKSPDGDQGFPGNLDFSVTYTLWEDAVELTYEGISDADTVFNPTNHSYFNLGYQDTIYDHDLRIKASGVAEVDSELMPTGNIIDVTDTVFDFRETRKLGDAFKQPLDPYIVGTQGIDHNYIFDDPDISESLVTLSCEESGIKMDIFTDLPAVQVYTGNNLRDILGIDGKMYNKNGGICLETGYVPDSVNIKAFKSPVIKKGEKVVYTTIFKFSNL